VGVVFVCFTAISISDVQRNGTDAYMNLCQNRSLNYVRTELLQQMQGLQGAPSVQMQEVPPPFELKKRKAEGEKDGGADDDVRDKGRGRTKDGEGERKAHDAEFYDGDGDNKDIPRAGS